MLLLLALVLILLLPPLPLVLLLRLSLHIASLSGERREWSTTESFVFDDGYDHAVYTPEAEGSEVGPRVVLAVGISHPDLEHGSGAEIEEGWRKEL